jgi:hypothetical protein
MRQLNHTMFAGEAIGLAQLFQHAFGKKRLEGPVSYAVEMSTPDGPSTAGGKQPLQHLKLIPQGGGPALLVGTANLVDKEAELRTFLFVDQAHRQRWKGAAFSADPVPYQELMDSIRAFLVQQRYAVTLLDVGPPEPAVPVAGVAKLPNASPTRLILTVALTAALVVAAAAFLRHQHAAGRRPAPTAPAPAG